MPTPDFIVSLRKKIGHDLLLVPTVAVIARNDQGELLLVRDSKTGEWECPGGILEPGELPSEAAVRETYEEGGVVVALTRIVGVFGGDACESTYANGDRLAWVATVFAATVTSGTPQADGAETSDARFFSAAQLDTLQIKSHSRRFLAQEEGSRDAACFVPSSWQPGR